MKLVDLFELVRLQNNDNETKPIFSPVFLVGNHEDVV